MSESDLAQKIEQQFRDEFIYPFPLDDVLKLKLVDPRNWNYLHGFLDLYFADIAGYAYQASRLDRRPKAKLLEAKEYLSKPFFEKHSSLAIYRDAITAKSAPHLFKNMETVEQLRKELLVLIDKVLSYGK